MRRWLEIGVPVTLMLTLIIPYISYTAPHPASAEKCLVVAPILAEQSPAEKNALNPKAGGHKSLLKCFDKCNKSYVPATMASCDKDYEQCSRTCNDLYGLNKSGARKNM